MKTRRLFIFLSLIFALFAFSKGFDQARDIQKMPRMRSTTAAQRKAAATRAAAARTKPSLLAAPAAQNKVMAMAAPPRGGTPDYFGIYPNYANSPAPVVDPVTHAISGGIRKFVDGLPGLGPAGANNLGQFIPLAIPDTTTYPGSDYYQISLVNYTQQMHSDLPATIRLRGYKDLAPGADGKAHYLGPLIWAKQGRPVRIKFTNNLIVGSTLLLPVDTTIMGAGFGPLGPAEGITPRTALRSISMAETRHGSAMERPTSGRSRSAKRPRIPRA